MTPAHPTEWLPVAHELADALRTYRDMADTEWVELPAGALTRPRWLAARQAVRDFGATYPEALREGAKRVGSFLDLDASNLACAIGHSHDPRGFWEAPDVAALEALEVAISGGDAAIDRARQLARGEQPLFDLENIA